MKVAHPDKPVVAIAGDGGFMFNVQELATAVQYKIGLVTVIFNSNSFSNVKRQQQEWFGNRTIASDLVNPDFVKLAQSFGAAGLRVNSPQELRAALRKAFAEPGPTIIEVPVGEMASPVGVHHSAAPRNRRTRSLMSALAAKTSVAGPRPRSGVLSIRSYKQGASIINGVENPIKVSANESPLGPSPRAIAAYRAAAETLCRYSDGSQTALREAIANVHGLMSSASSAATDPMRFSPC